MAKRRGKPGDPRAIRHAYDYSSTPDRSAGGGMVTGQGNMRVEDRSGDAMHPGRKAMANLFAAQRRGDSAGILDARKNFAATPGVGFTGSLTDHNQAFSGTIGTSATGTPTVQPTANPAAMPPPAAAAAAATATAPAVPPVAATTPAAAATAAPPTPEIAPPTLSDPPRKVTAAEVEGLGEDLRAAGKPVDRLAKLDEYKQNYADWHKIPGARQLEVARSAILRDKTTADETLWATDAGRAYDAAEEQGDLDAAAGIVADLAARLGRKPPGKLGYIHDRLSKGLPAFTTAADLAGKKNAAKYKLLTADAESVIDSKMTDADKEADLRKMYDAAAAMVAAGTLSRVPRPLVNAIKAMDAGRVPWDSDQPGGPLTDTRRAALKSSAAGHVWGDMKVHRDYIPGARGKEGHWEETNTGGKRHRAVEFTDLQDVPAAVTGTKAYHDLVAKTVGGDPNNRKYGGLRKAWEGFRAEHQAGGPGYTDEQLAGLFESSIAGHDLLMAAWLKMFPGRGPEAQRRATAETLLAKTIGQFEEGLQAADQAETDARSQAEADQAAAADPANFQVPAGQEGVNVQSALQYYYGNIPGAMDGPPLPAQPPAMGSAVAPPPPPAAGGTPPTGLSLPTDAAAPMATAAPAAAAAAGPPPPLPTDPQQTVPPLDNPDGSANAMQAPPPDAPPWPDEDVVYSVKPDLYGWRHIQDPSLGGWQLWRGKDGQRIWIAPDGTNYTDQATAQAAAPTAAAPAAAAGAGDAGKYMDRTAAEAILAAADGDPAMAAELARNMGYRVDRLEGE